MPEVGRAEAEREGLANIVFHRGDATALPSLDSPFTAVVCRYARHHFPDRDAVMTDTAALREARTRRPGRRRACRPGDAHNAIKRLRDPSHACALSASDLQSLIVDHGLEATAAETREILRPLGPWLEQSATRPRPTLTSVFALKPGE